MAPSKPQPPPPQQQPPPPPPPPHYYYVPIPTSPSDQNYVVLPLYHPHHRRRGNCSCCRYATAASLLLLALAVYVLWPSDPVLDIVRLRLHRVRVRTFPRIAVDISLALSVKVRNTDVYSMNYKWLHVAVAYRGKELGHVKSDGGHVRARGASYVDALVEFNGVEVLYDVVYLLEDLKRGTVPFDTFTQVRGLLGLLFFQVPLQAKVSCEIYVSTANQTITRQNCYPE